MLAIVVPRTARSQCCPGGWTRPGLERQPIEQASPFCPVASPPAPSSRQPSWTPPDHFTRCLSPVCPSWGAPDIYSPWAASPTPAVSQIGWAWPLSETQKLPFLGPHSRGIRARLSGFGVGFCTPSSPVVVAEGQPRRSPQPRDSSGLSKRPDAGRVGIRRDTQVPSSRQCPQALHSVLDQAQGHSSGLPPCKAAHVPPNPACSHFFRLRVVSGTKLGSHEGIQSRVAPCLWDIGAVTRPRSLCSYLPWNAHGAWGYTEVQSEPASGGALCVTPRFPGLSCPKPPKCSSRPPGWVGTPLVLLPSSCPQPADRRTQAWPPALHTASSSAQSSFIHLFAKLLTP